MGMMMHSASKKYRVSLFALILAFVLSACGVTVHSKLTINDDESGMREFFLYVSQEDLDTYTDVSAEDIDAVIADALPGQLSYSGMVFDEEHAGYRATMTLEFSSLDDYKAKVAALLEYSGVDLEPEITFEQSGDGMRRSLTYHENFATLDMLGWIPRAVTEAGILPAEDAEMMMSGGDRGIVIGGEGYVPREDPFKVESEDNRELDGMQVRITQLDEGYEVSLEVGRYGPFDEAQVNLLDEVLAERAPDGADITEDARFYDSARTVTFTASDEADVVTKLGTITGDSEARFSAEIGMKDSLQTLTLDGHFGCGDICRDSDYATTAVFLPSKAWVPIRADAGSPYSHKGVFGRFFESATFTVTFERSLAFTDMTGEFTMNGDGSMSEVFTFSVDEATLEGFGGSMAELLPAGLDIDEKVEDGKAIATFTVSGANTEEFTANLETIIPNSSVSGGKTGGGLFSSSYELTYNVPMARMLSPGGVPGTVTHIITLPSGQSVDITANPAGFEADGHSAVLTVDGYDGKGLNEMVELTSSGTNLIPIIAIIAALLILAVLIIAIIVRRRRRPQIQQPYPVAPSAPGAPGPWPVGPGSHEGGPQPGGPQHQPWQNQAGPMPPQGVEGPGPHADHDQAGSAASADQAGADTSPNHEGGDLGPDSGESGRTPS